MKLYTEEEIKATLKSIDCEEVIGTFLEFADPIELPSDEEVYELATDGRDNHSDYNNGFIQGVKWLKAQISGKEDKDFK